MEQSELAFEQQEHKMMQEKKRAGIIYKMLNVALDVISDRLLLFVTALISAAFFGWTLYAPSTDRTLTACLFSAMIFWPILWYYIKRPKRD